MKILLPNAKELNTNEESYPWQTLSENSAYLLTHFLRFSEKELASFYKISEDKARLEMDRFKRIATEQARTYPAFLLYDGLMYRYMSRRELEPSVKSYWHRHVRIATGFYGLIDPFTLISPHRLDFQGKLDLEGRSLKQFWRQDYDKELEGEDTILSLLSSEFEQVFSPPIQSKMTKVVFMEEKQGQFKVHSTISKKGRGRLVSLMAEKGIQDIEELKKLEFDGFSYHSQKSTTKQFVFTRIG